VSRSDRTRFGLVTLLKVASLPKMMKPDIGGEAMSSTRRTFRRGWGQRAGIDQSRRPGRAGKGQPDHNGPRESITKGAVLAGSRRGS
jgi:hypothetical protein